MQEIHHDRLLIFTACLYTPPIGRAGDCAVLAEADAHVPHDLSPVQDAAVPEPRAVREHRLLGSAGSLACLSLAHIGGAYPFLKILFIYSFIYLSEDGFFFFFFINPAQIIREDTVVHSPPLPRLPRF